MSGYWPDRFRYYIYLENGLWYSGNYSGYAWYYNTGFNDRDEVTFDTAQEAIDYLEEQAEKERMPTPPPIKLVQVE